MPHTLKVPPPGFEALSIEEQVDYLQALWEVIAVRLDKVPVPEWHCEILDERLAEFEWDPGEGVSWGEFGAELDAEAQR
jgi:hypothetical protein